MNSANNPSGGDARQQRVQFARKVRTRVRSASTQQSATTPAQAGRPLKPDAASLKEAIRLAQQGDAAAFETIYQLHSRRVYALCLRMTGDPVEAADLTQEAFLQLFRKIHTFRGESAFSSWMHRLTANIVLMRFRKKRPFSVSLEGSMEFGEVNGQTSKEVGQVDVSLTGSIDRVCLENAIEQLPAGYKLSIELHDIQGYKHTEIAKIMECSVGTSKAQLHRARKKLRGLLREKFDWQWFPQTARNPVPLSST